MTEKMTPAERREHRNEIQLIGFYGSDMTHALSAWTTTQRELTVAKRERIPAFLKGLAQDGHHTPFEKSTLHFLATTDIATHIHLLKHRIGVSVNSESARYKELKEDKWYLPWDWRVDEAKRLDDHIRESFEKYHTELDRLIARGMDRKRAKESARFYLPYAMQYEIDVTFNFRSFMHFQKLRNSPHSQREVSDVAKEMLRLVKETGAFNYSLMAFGYS